MKLLPQIKSIAMADVAELSCPIMTKEMLKAG
jgi:hypothetical protein